MQLKNVSDAPSPGASAGEVIMLGFIGVVVFLFAALIMSGIRVLNEYQRGVVLTLGRYTGS